MSENSLVPLYNKEIYITNAEFEGCFIKIWGHFFCPKRSNMEKSLQNYESYSRDMKTIDLYGNTPYIYVWKLGIEVRVYRCKIISSDFQTKIHTILLIDYGRTMVASFVDVREISMDVNKSIINGLTQRASVYTYLLSGYISKSKSNSELNELLSNQYYSYRTDFEIEGVSFITLLNLDNKILLETGMADTIELSKIIIIANNMSKVLSLNKKRDIKNSCPIPAKESDLQYLRSQQLDNLTIQNIFVTKVSVGEDTILLTVRTVDYESEYLQKMLQSIDRQNLVLSPVLEVHTPCLILVQNKFARAVILDVKINGLLVDLIDYGIHEFVLRTTVFQIPTECNVIEMRSLNVILDKPKDFSQETIKKLLLNQNFGMLPKKIDPNYGLYKIELFSKKGNEICDVFVNQRNENENSVSKCSLSPKSSNDYLITEIQDDDKISTTGSCSFTILHQSNNDQITIDSQEERISSIEKITCLQVEKLSNKSELLCVLLTYKSPMHFFVRQYNADFHCYFENIKSSLEERYILKKFDIIKNMYVILKHYSGLIYRAQVVNMDSIVERIELKLVDEGNEIVNEEFDKIVLYNFLESDCIMPAQLVLECSLSDMWFPLLNIDVAMIVKSHFHNASIYKCIITGKDEIGRNSVKMIEKDSNIDIADSILKSGFGQRLESVMKTEETPYEESVLNGQSFLSYVVYSHYKLFIQPEPYTVDELEEEIKNYITDNPIYEPISLIDLQGKYCLATLNNGQWFRAYVKNISDESIIVKLFDIGLLTDVTISQVRPITKDLMKKPQLCLICDMETKELSFKIAEKTLYNVTVTSIKPNGLLSVKISEHFSSPLPIPVVRGIEKISKVHVDGDVAYLQRVEDHCKLLKMSETLSKINSKLCITSIMNSGDLYMFENHGLYYRCVIKSVNLKMANVHCIDYGYEKQLEKKKLQFIGSNKVAKLPGLAIPVKTFPGAINITNIFLTNLFINDDKSISAAPFKINLILPHGDIIENLKNKCLVKISCMYSYQDCWIVPDMQYTKEKLISEALDQIQTKTIFSVSEVGALCAALHPLDKKWYRALVLSVANDSLNVLAIDTGEHFKTYKTTKLASGLQSIPNLAINCRIKSNVDAKKFVNKMVFCKLISCEKPLIEVELFINDDLEDDTPLHNNLTVNISKFESFNEFYVVKVENCENTNGDSINISSVNKLFYHCWMEETDDIYINDPKNYDQISEIMTSREWVMQIKNDKEPFLVKLTNNGQDCVDVILDNLVCVYSDYETPEGTNKHEDSSSDNIEQAVTTESGLCYVKNAQVSGNISLENLIIPKLEKVVIIKVETLHWFYIHSVSLFDLYKDRIIHELDMCIIELKVNAKLLNTVVVTFSNKKGTWCRAVVDKIISESIAYCYFIDYGMYENCSEFYKPTEFLSLCPFIVRRCALIASKLEDKENEIWYPNVLEMFKDISSINGLVMDMIVQKEGSPSLVILQIEGNDISEMLLPQIVVITHIESFSNFIVQTVSSDLNTIKEEFKLGNITLVPVDDPKIGDIYIANINLELKRIRFDALGGTKYVVIDIDDTLDAISVDCLYEVPEKIQDIPIFTLRCSLILDDNEKNYSFDNFKRISKIKNEAFVMCIITETDGKSPNLVKLYLNNKNIQDFIIKSN
ncbi:uncharacterized protein LOC126908583 [Daktulosphaira vitifoliae]|uniref:uncharacterized protein LOC126908583 n=1 Tax=Daktulosphaira vitifoliae TaxID=58002 RepID=UPI0021AA36F5|nr:uncharacterized protein LOC126908583 [Daktulosphaira vitifoliae]XP_050546740.1 uncharacterized protein LOC126908583 [Daktulosphaira vitifoliae]XP_050546741.1 uncharacterized protein LOC126908583 [Daktulosphaira vitifoliae]XP_050546742.1 uncharacterized protein LOC126908583 [Daktulosphaira vitifoliae]XP_050546743.1 uncharacterized protein LOC126908583 [Daktulosphaira vitifoliae]